MMIRYATIDELEPGQRTPHRQVTLDLGERVLRTDPLIDAGRERDGGNAYVVHVDVPLGAERWDYSRAFVVVSVPGSGGAPNDDAFLEIDLDSLPQLIAALTTAGLAAHQLRKDHA